MFRRFIDLSRAHIEQVNLHVLLMSSFHNFGIEWCSSFAIGAPSVTLIVFLGLEDSNEGCFLLDKLVEHLLEVLKSNLNHLLVINILSSETYILKT